MRQKGARALNLRVSNVCGIRVSRVRSIVAVSLYIGIIILLCVWGLATAQPSKPGLNIIPIEYPTHDTAVVYVYTILLRICVRPYFDGRFDDFTQKSQ